MIIAVPTKENKVDDHFGHCAYYTLFTVKDGKVVEKKRLESPQGCGCKSGIAPVLHEMGVEVMLAGSMGDGAKNVLQKNQIKVVRGCSGDVEKLVNDYLAGSITDSGEGCASHGEHSCPDHA